jgi:putative heme-binding domain-containing protein
MPIGSVLAKTYAMPVDYRQPEKLRRIETQVALKDAQGEWQFYTYRWNDQGSDAELVPASGASQSIAIEEASGPRKLRWQFASRSQCRTCHTPWTGETVGFIEAQLRNPRESTDAWRHLSQDGWSTINDKPRPLNDEEYFALVDPHDASQPLDRRARSYLHANCAHCHMNGGNASTVFETLFNKPLVQSKMLVSKPMRGDFGLRECQIVTPGSPTQSVLYYRMAKSGTGRMPHIGSQLTDATGVRLIGQWIASLPKNTDHLAALDELCGPTAGKNDVQRLKAARELLGSLDSCIELSTALAERRVPARLVHPIVAEAMKLDDAARRELIEPYAAADQQVVRLGPTIDVVQLLSMEGDPTRGEKLFAAGVGQCSQCHRIANVGKEVGPDLSRIADKLKTREKILNSIIDPSAEIEDKYRAVTVLTVDGQTRVGRVLSRSDQRLTLQDAEGKQIEIPTDDIELEKPVPNSLMPQQLLSQLTAEQAANLIAYLYSLR